MPQKMNGLLQTYISEIKKIYGTHLSKIILYGSYARGDFRPDSDVDIMILLDLSDLDLKKYSKELSYMTYDFNLDNDIDIKIGTRKDLVSYRIETAKSDLKSAKILLNAGEYKGANNRAYYAIFHAINAVHALDGRAFKRHKDAIANFNKDYVKTEIFPREVGRKIGEAEEIRVIMMIFILQVKKRQSGRLQLQENL